MKKPAYSAALDRVLFRASRLARELGGAQTGTEHLLLALSQERISQTGRILCYQGAEGRLLRCMLLTKREQPEPSGRQGFSGGQAAITKKTNIRRDVWWWTTHLFPS